MGCVALVQIVAKYEEGEQLYLEATRYSVSFNLLPELPCLASVPAVTVTLESLLPRAPEPTLPEAAVKKNSLSASDAIMFLFWHTEQTLLSLFQRR